MISIAADETERQRDTIPKAVKRVSYRLPLYYIGAVIVLGLNVSSTDPILKNSVNSTGQQLSSPFVLMIQRAGIPGLPHVINAVALIAVLSVANANLYVSVCNLCSRVMVESNTVCTSKGGPGTSYL
jgi:yeast amino acid transporter